MGLVKLNGASKVAIASNKGVKLNTARQLEAGHVYYEIDRKEPEAAWKKIKEDNPMGFDVVVSWTHTFLNWEMFSAQPL